MKLLMCNLKTNQTLNEFESYIKEISQFEKKDNLVIFPTQLYLSMMAKYNISFGAQDISVFTDGAKTGEVTANQVKSTKANYVIIGHSERRINFHEDEHVLEKKIKNALDENLTIVYCIGETEEEKLRKKTYQVLEKQIAKIFNKLSEKEMQNIIIAYEPIWAIGTGISASVNEIQEITMFIKKLILDYYDINIKVLYGGSVKSENITLINKIEALDGYLVGSASLKPVEVAKMLQEISLN